MAVVRWWSDSVVAWDDICCIALHCMVLCAAEGVLLTERTTHLLVVPKDPRVGKQVFCASNSNRRIKHTTTRQSTKSLMEHHST